MSIGRVLKSIYHKLPSPPSSNYVYRRIKPSPYDFLPPRPLIYDIGSGSAGAQYAIGKLPTDAKVVCVDIEDRVGVDLVADAHDLGMIDDNTADFVMSISVLEHVKYPERVMKEIHRILKPGGIVYISVPFVYPFHADPSDYRRFSYKGIEILGEDFEKIDSGFNRGPASTMLPVFGHFVSILFSFNSNTIYSMNFYVFRWLSFWLKYLDKFLAKYKMAYKIHGSAYFMGKKAMR